MNTVSDYIKSSEKFEYVGCQTWGNVSSFYCDQDQALHMVAELDQASEPIIDHPDVSGEKEPGYFIQSGDLWYIFSDGSRDAVLVAI